MLCAPVAVCSDGLIPVANDFVHALQIFPLRDARHCVRLIFLIKTDRERARASALLEHGVCNTKQHVHRCGI